MEENAYLTAVVAGCFYMVAGVRLLRLGLRTRERPELMLSAYFAATGIFYLGINAPSIFRFDALPPQIETAIIWLYLIGVFPYLFFIRRVFRPRAAWASGMVAVCGIFLALGGAHLIVESPLVETLDNPWFIIMWLGYALPAMWMGWEAMLAHRSANKRARIGLCDPAVSNRYLLLGWFGCFQTLAVLVGLYWAYDKDVHQVTSSFADALLGGTEIAGVSTLWLAFFPPTWYRNWIANRAVITPTPMDGLRVATSLFDYAADQLERNTSLDRLAARGTLRIAMKNAGLDIQTLTTVQLRAVFEKLMPKELESRGISNAPVTCEAVMAAIARGAASAESARSTSSDEILKRLGES